MNINFDKKPISGAVGYNVTYSSSETFTFTFNVPAGQTKVIRYKDWYHVTNMDVHTTYWYCGPGWCETHKEYGKAWAAKWYQRIFYAQRIS